jgi:tetratricopeptide (TPR) repeat protein
MPTNILQYGVSLFYMWIARTHRHFGIIYASQDEYESAVSDYSRALDIYPGFAQAYLERGILMWRELGQMSRAVGDFTVALRLRPGWPEALFFRGLAHQGMSNYHEAVRDLSDYLASRDSSWREDAVRQLSLMRPICDEAAETQHPG